MVLSDREILMACRHGWSNQPMISPYVENKQYMGDVSYGQSSFGYDFRITGKVKQLALGQTADPAGPRPNLKDLRYTVKDLEGFVIMPGMFVLAATLEYFSIPGNIVAVAADKSTLARIGLAVQNTVMEPQWEGYLTVEISNHGPIPVILRDGMPISQMMFYQGSYPAYGYDGRYQKQKPGTPALAAGMPADVVPGEA